MEDRKLSEKESLDIITQMINSSKRNMKVGSGNVLLYWGYFTVLLSVVISSLIVYTQNYIWSWGWMLMFAVGPVISYKQRGCEPAVVTIRIRRSPVYGKCLAVCLDLRSS